MTASTLTTIENVNALLAGTTIAPIALPQTQTPITRNPAHDAQMAVKDATKGQMARINAKYATMGLRTFPTLSAFRSVFPTMLDASVEWASIR